MTTSNNDGQRRVATFRCLYTSYAVRTECERLSRLGFDRLALARHMLALKGVIDHWPLWVRYGRIGNFRTFQLPLP